MKEFSLREVERHCSEGDCWIIYSGGVYDVTSFLGEHPGGKQEILDYAGKEATLAFTGIEHSEYAYRRLEMCKIGVLKVKFEMNESSIDMKESKNAESPIENKTESKMNITSESKKTETNSKTNSGSLRGEITGRKKQALAPGHSAMHWMLKHASIRKSMPRAVSAEELLLHRSERDLWMSIHGRVYDVTEYVSYHPGGVQELLRGAGQDATALFQSTHAWVNISAILGNCLIGFLDQ